MLNVLDYAEKIYLWGFVALESFVLLSAAITQRQARGVCGDKVEDASGCESSGRLTNYEFLPLMVTSVYCGIGLCWSFVRLSFLYLTQK
jgi:alpha-1,3-glucosyltransferase